MVSAVKTASLGLEVYEQTRSLELFERAERVIPGAKLGGSVICPAGMYGHYSPNAMAPGYPIYFSDARGALMPLGPFRISRPRGVVQPPTSTRYGFVGEYPGNSGRWRPDRVVRQHRALHSDS